VWVMSKPRFRQSLFLRRVFSDVSGCYGDLTVGYEDARCSNRYVLRFDGGPFGVFWAEVSDR